MAGWQFAETTKTSLLPQLPLRFSRCRVKAHNPFILPKLPGPVLPRTLKHSS